MTRALSLICGAWSVKEAIAFRPRDCRRHSHFYLELKSRLHGSLRLTSTPCTSRVTGTGTIYHRLKYCQESPVGSFRLHIRGLVITSSALENYESYTFCRAKLLFGV